MTVLCWKRLRRQRIVTQLKVVQFLRVPQVRRIVFVGLETALLASPVMAVVTALGGVHGAAAGACAGALEFPFLFGLTGMLVWISVYLSSEKTYCRVGLFTIFAILVLFWAGSPAMAW